MSVCTIQHMRDVFVQGLLVHREDVSQHAEGNPVAALLTDHLAIAEQEGVVALHIVHNPAGRKTVEETESTEKHIHQRFAPRAGMVLRLQSVDDHLLCHHVMIVFFRIGTEQHQRQQDSGKSRQPPPSKLQRCPFVRTLFDNRR